MGGYEEVVRRFFEAYPNTTLQNYGNASDPYWKCGIPPENSMNLVRAYDDGSLPWPGIMFGLTISSVWYWCSDQVCRGRELLLPSTHHHLPPPASSAPSLILREKGKMQKIKCYQLKDLIISFIQHKP